MSTGRFLAAAIALAFGSSLHAWDYAGHRMVNQAAIAALPPDFPAFVREPAAVERIAFLAGEPDRWRNVPDLIMKQSGGSWSDHFCDLEMLPDAGLDPAGVSSFRYDFIVAFAKGRAANAGKFAPIDPAKNADHTEEWPGFAPWAIAEYYVRLRSAFSYLKVFEEIGTPEEIANARANAIYTMGVMGHYVGDIAQPLHTTIHHAGWVGENPHGYATWKGFHSWIDGTFLAQVGVRYDDVARDLPVAQPISIAPREDGREPLFVAVMDYLIAQNAQVEPLYRLEKAGHLKADGTGDPGPGRDFLVRQLRTGSGMLANIWVTAWRNAVPDVYLRTALLKRQGVPPPPAAP